MVSPGAKGVSSPIGVERIWIVDDSPMEAEVARRALEPDYIVEIFEATARARSSGSPRCTRPDLLILDWLMPGMSGLEVCRFIRETLYQGTLPILILTAVDHTHELVEGLGAGANDFVRKSFDQAELQARVLSILRTARLLRSIRDAERREREAREEAEEANRTKDEFLAIVSHELRTPLNAILGWARMLRNPDVPRTSHPRALEIIERNAAVQGRLIEDILDVSRILAGKLRVDLAPVESWATSNTATRSRRRSRPPTRRASPSSATSIPRSSTSSAIRIASNRLSGTSSRTR